MSTATQKAEVPEDYIKEVVIYGLRRRRNVRRLIDALADIPICPDIIFSVDRLGRLLGVVDHLRDQKVCYVRVHHWGSDSGTLPYLGWSWDPTRISRGLKGRASKRLLLHKSELRAEPLVVKFSVKEHAKLCAIMMRDAS